MSMTSPVDLDGRALRPQLTDLDWIQGVHFQN